MTPSLGFRVSLVLTALLLAALPAAADAVQLANGDVLNGKVLSLDDKQLSLESESLGQLTIPRGKIVTITLGNAKPAAAVVDPKTAPAAPKAGTSVEEAVKQLKAGGVNPKDVADLQKLFPELAAPGASKYFSETVAGLIGGKTSVQDIRKDAIQARDELNKLTKDLGPDVAAAVAPYLSILEKFIKETEPTDPKAKPAIPPDPKATPPDKK
jgi:hypothetical protein